MKLGARDLFSVEGRGVVITGAGGRVGSVLCAAFAEARAKVFGLVRREPRHVIDQVNYLRCDLAASEEINAVTSSIAAQAPIDVLINAAHAPHGPRELSQFEPDMLAGEHAVGLSAPILLAKAVAPQMAARAGGSIVNMGSVYGRLAPPYQLFGREDYGSSLSYACVKGGVLQLTRYLAAALSDQNIRVNSLSAAPLPEPHTLEENEWYSSGLVRHTPLGRPGTPADLVGAALFLASDASAFVTGHDLVVDGGWSIW